MKYYYFIWPDGSRFRCWGDKSLNEITWINHHPRWAGRAYNSRHWRFGGALVIGRSSSPIYYTFNPAAGNTVRGHTARVVYYNIIRVESSTGYICTICARIYTYMNTNSPTSCRHSNTDLWHIPVLNKWTTTAKLQNSETR